MGRLKSLESTESQISRPPQEECQCNAIVPCSAVTDDLFLVLPLLLYAVFTDNYYQPLEDISTVVR